MDNALKIVDMKHLESIKASDIDYLSIETLRIERN